MPLELSPQRFFEVKREILDTNDMSSKGCNDSNIKGVISLLNGCSDMVALKSCSGRFVIVSKEGQGFSKGRCHFIFVTHDKVLEEDVFKSLSKIDGNLTIKFEPFILHVKCRMLLNAMELLKCASDSGYKNSGITIGRRGNITVAIRSTLNMEVPISSNGKLIVPDEYLKYLIWLANEKMVLNQDQITKFQNILQAGVECWGKPEKGQFPIEWSRPNDMGRPLPWNRQKQVENFRYAGRQQSVNGSPFPWNKQKIANHASWNRQLDSRSSATWRQHTEETTHPSLWTWQPNGKDKLWENGHSVSWRQSMNGDCVPVSCGRQVLNKNGRPYWRRQDRPNGSHQTVVDHQMWVGDQLTEEEMMKKPLNGDGQPEASPSGDDSCSGLLSGSQVFTFA